MKLNKANLADYVGKTIRYTAPSAKENLPSAGVCIIETVDMNERFPVKSKSIIADDMRYAFFDRDDNLCIGDEFRVVDAEIYDGMTELEESIAVYASGMPTMVFMSEPIQEGCIFHHFIVDGENNPLYSVAIEYPNGDVCTLYDWQIGYIPNKDQIEDFAWQFYGREAIMMNGLPRIL